MLHYIKKEGKIGRPHVDIRKVTTATKYYKAIFRKMYFQKKAFIYINRQWQWSIRAGCLPLPQI